ncbi:hypothetical protein [Synechococcus sp. PCC 6312]|uniref:hypothetical protein n=1 Tax=Synechococcus sp. (strain ATCC 27167 / PCC 6312) TaxID=195253 RepID=UPI00029F3A9C|nr:hypothetical protein [Synechococcus sp. PCC 6312]AFY60537.1 hypothetical protein Syn6312_1366 [Synechococcus sp. PCC 6312]
MGDKDAEISTLIWYLISRGFTLREFREYHSNITNQQWGYKLTRYNPESNLTQVYWVNPDNVDYLTKRLKELMRKRF